MKFESFISFLSLAINCLFLPMSLLNLLFRPSNAFSNGASSTASSKPYETTKLSFQNEQSEVPNVDLDPKMASIVRMRNADLQKSVLPENARSLLEETLRTLYSHRITHHIQFKKAQQTFADNMDTWIELQIHVEARRRSEQLEQEITLVKKCIAALQAKTVTPPLQKKIQLLLGTDFKDSKHHLSSQLLVEDSQIKPSSTLTKRKPFPSTPKQRLPAFAFA